MEQRLRSPVAPSDRLAATLCIAVILHAMIVLGITFTPEPTSKRSVEGLEITLVTQKSSESPEHAELLAQANAKGGGTDDKKGRPATPLVAPLPSPAPAIAATMPRAERPATEQELPLDPMTRAPTPTKQKVTETTHKPSPAPTVQLKPVKEAPEPIITPQSKQAESEGDATPTAKTESTTNTESETTADALPSAAQLITRSFALASLHAELEQKLDMRAQRPRLKFVSATTQEYRYAAYMEAWRAKVERIGNLNYPDEARQKKLSGALLLDVALRPNGSVLEVIVRRSSGHKVLDDAAVRIVELAGPYAEFPDEIRREVDILHITRTWKFLSNESFTAQ